VPGASNAVPFTVSQRQFFAELTVSMKGLLNRGSHVTWLPFEQPTQFPARFIQVTSESLAGVKLIAEILPPFIARRRQTPAMKS
jgi:hypothetical protein